MGEEIVNSEPQIKIERAWLGKVLYGLRNEGKKEEIYISGYDMGNRIYLVKRFSDKYWVVKVSSHRTLCGARGMGMVFDCPTAYYLMRIEEDELDPGWNHWKGRATFLYEMHCGKAWKLGLQELEKKYNEIKDEDKDLE